MASHRAALSSSREFGPLRATLTYLPTDLLAIREAGVEQPVQIAERRKEYAGLAYYQLRLEMVAGQGDILQFQASNSDDYYQRVEYYSFGLQQDLRLLAGVDTLPCKLFHFERNYGAAPYMDFMLGFEPEAGRAFDLTLIYEDRVYTHQTIQLVIPKEAIQQIPTLKL